MGTFYGEGKTKNGVAGGRVSTLSLRVEVLMLVFIAMALVGGGDVGPPPVPESVTITDPVWVRRPTAEDIARAYPTGATNRGLNGQTGTLCRVTAEGTLSECAPGSEDPVGEGFAEAAVEVMDRFKMKLLSASGQPVVGRAIRIPVSWRLPTTATSAPIQFAVPGATNGRVDVDCRFMKTGLDNCFVVRSEPHGLVTDALVLRQVQRLKLRPAPWARGRIVIPFNVVATEKTTP